MTRFMTDGATERAKFIINLGKDLQLAKRVRARLKRRLSRHCKLHSLRYRDLRGTPVFQQLERWTNRFNRLSRMLVAMDNPWVMTKVPTPRELLPWNGSVWAECSVRVGIQKLENLVSEADSKVLLLASRIRELESEIDALKERNRSLFVSLLNKENEARALPSVVQASCRQSKTAVHDLQPGQDNPVRKHIRSIIERCGEPDDPIAKFDLYPKDYKEDNVVPPSVDWLSRKPEQPNPLLPKAARRLIHKLPKGVEDEEGFVLPRGKARARRKGFRK